jgi:hypothetical protein
MDGFRAPRPRFAGRADAAMASGRHHEVSRAPD